MRNSLLSLLMAGTAGIAMFGADAAEAQSTTLTCGTSYTVQPGDSLSGIAAQVYGRASDFQIIYSANSETIGQNPGIIRVGMRLDLPCVNTTQASVADEAAIRPVQTTAQLPAPEVDMIRVVVGSDWAPFTNEDQAQGGMLTEITNVSLANSDADVDYRIDFVNDWGAHLQPLISDHRYDFSIAWFRPNCDKIELLGDESQFRCNNLSWSEPLYEQIFGYYTRVGDSVARYSDLMGRRICRPAGYATFQLEENGLKEPAVSMIRPDSPADCFLALANGDVDVVAMAAEVAETAMADTRTGNRILYNEGLSQVMTAHAVIAQNHPRRDEMLAALDSGILKIKNNGEWFAIVTRHIAEHRAFTQ
ncbi:MAG: transporter substrate-binding domain-containing protein [Pseudomonadota bacterium]